jgi:hypothetical protein
VGNFKLNVSKKNKNKKLDENWEIATIESLNFLILGNF